MIVIEASNINVGGSMNLLLDLANFCELTNRKVKIYVIYDIVYKLLSEKEFKNISVVKTNLWYTLFRYILPFRRNVLYFCSIPPLAYNWNSFLYFHSEYYAKPISSDSSNLSMLEKVKRILYYPVIKFGLKNCKKVYCQNEYIKSLLNTTYGISPEIKPFFPGVKKSTGNFYLKRTYDFIYPALTSKHKNHLRLLDAVLELRSIRKFNIILTIPDTSSDLIRKVQEINSLYPNTILNWGILDHSKIIQLLFQTRWLVFPSLMESLGLPLLEAVECGTKVVASDLEYTRTCIDNPVTFNPNSVNSIVRTLQKVLDGDFDDVVQSSLIKDSKEYIMKQFGC